MRESTRASPCSRGLHPVPVFLLTWAAKQVNGKQANGTVAKPKAKASVPDVLLESRKYLQKKLKKGVSWLAMHPDS